MAGVNKEVNVFLNSFYKATGIRAFQKDLKRLNIAVTDNGRVFDNLTGQVKSQGKAFKELANYSSRFRMEFLGIMFGGMAIKNTFGQIQRAAIKTFSDVMSTVEGATTNISMLSANFDYLKFTIGSVIDTALAPFMPMIIRLIQGFADLVEQHPEETFWAIAGAFAAGSALAIGGSFFLFADALARIFGFPSLGAIGGLPGVLKGISKWVWMHPELALIAAALAIIADLSWEAFEDSPEAWDSVMNSIKEMKEPFLDLVDSFVYFGEYVLGELMPTNLEDFAWALAWIAKIASKFFNSFMALLSLVIESVLLGAKAWTAFWTALRGGKADVAGLVTSLARIDKSVSNLKDASSGIIDLIGGGWQEFKKSEIASQKHEKFLDWWNSDQTKTSQTDVFGRELVVNVNVDGETIGKSNYIKLLNSIQRYDIPLKY